MIFKIIAMETELFAEDKFDDLKNIVYDECKDSDAPLLDLFNKNVIPEEAGSMGNSLKMSQKSELGESKRKKRIHRSKKSSENQVKQVKRKLYPDLQQGNYRMKKKKIFEAVIKKERLLSRVSIIRIIYI